MSVDRPGEKLGAREALDVVNQVFPNIGRFLRVVLKNEQLSQEAESLRVRFDTLLGKLERMSRPMREDAPLTRPASFSGSKLYHLRKMHTRHGTFSGLQKDRKSCSGDLLEKDNAPYKHNGHLLCKEPTKSRWHRYSCYVSSLDAQLYLYDPSDNSSLVTTIPLEGKAIVSGEEIDQQTEKENSFVITRINDGVHEYHLAAYSQEDFRTWMDVLTKVIENISLKAKRNSMPCFSNHPSDKLGVWTVVPPYDISSNGESSRDSAISSGSSNHRISWALNGSSSPFRGRRGFDLDLEEPITNGTNGRVPKPLPSPPVEHLPMSKSGDGDDITIYEDIEELQELVDKQLKQTHATISQMGKSKDYHRSGKSGKKRKKKDLALNTQTSGSSIVSLPLRDIMTTKSFSSSSMLTPTSTLTRRTTPTNSLQVPLPPLDRNILDRNTSIYSSFLHMRAVNTNWERKWFTLQKSVLTYTRNQEDKDGHVKMLVGCKVESFEDSKRNFAMRISQPKEPDMYLSAEDEIQFIEWLTKLQMATKVQTDLDGMEEFDGSTWNMADPRDSMVTNDSGNTSTSVSCRTSIVSIDYSKRMLPRPPTAEDSRAVTALIPTEDNPTDTAFLSDLNGEGIYDVPRSVIAPYGGKIVVGNMPDLYDHPRKAMMRDEGVYNSPEDEDIYAYPPDAMDDHTLLTQEQALQSLADYDYPKLARGSMVSSSASTYRDSSMTDSTLRDSHASYVTINAEEGQSIPPVLNGGPLYNHVNGEVKFSAGELSELMDPTSRASQAISEGLYDRPKSLWSTANEIEIEIEPMHMETTSGAIKGYLFRKEKRSWNKMLCCIQNNRFECFKGNTLALKLFLPGAEILPDPEVKRPYAFKIKHPRKEAVLQFAAESEMQYRMWLSAFIKAAAISVQSVNDVEQIRVVDATMKEKWKNLQVSQPSGNSNIPAIKKKLVKASTVDSNVDGADDTLQRKKKLFTKGMFSGKKKKKSSLDQSRGETASPISPKKTHSNEDILSADENETSIKRSHSLDTLISSARSPLHSPRRQLSKLQQQQQQQPKPIITDNKPLQIPLSNAGYLLVQQTRMQGDNAWVRYWSVFDNLVINFYPAVMEVGSHFKISLRGSRVSRAMQETQRHLSFMIWHLESGSRIFCVAENESEFISWFEILTNGSEHVVPSNQDNLRRSASFYYFDSDYKLPSDRLKNISEQFDGSEQTLTFSRDRLYTQSSLNSSQENMLQDSDYFLGSAGSLSSAGSPVQHAGILKYKSSSDKWIERYSMVRKSTLYLYKNPYEKTPVSAVVLPQCQVAKIEDEEEQFVFIVVEFEGKTPHTFATHSAIELTQWLRAIQECSDENVNTSDLHKMKQWLSNEDITLDDEKRKQYKSAENLAIIEDESEFKTMNTRKAKAMTIDSRPRRKKSQSSDTQSGFVEVLFKSSSWTIYWCTIKDRCLYMYQSQESDLPLKSVALARYNVQADNSHRRKPHCLVLTRTSSFPIYISLPDSLEKQSWLKALQKASHVEVVPLNAEKESLSSFESGSVKMGDSRSSALDQVGASSETADNSLERKKHAVLKQYERNMKKTHKFSKQTTDSLKREKRGLVAMKKQIAPHLERLKALSDNGDERAQEKFVALQIKIKQIDAVLPYLEKCISKNKEAEQKTIAILEKKRDEELAALEEGTIDATSSMDKNEGDSHTSTSDLYMRVLNDSHNLGDSSRISGIFGNKEVPKSGTIDHSTPQYQPELNGSSSTPHPISTGSLLMDTLLTPITPEYNSGSAHEQSSSVLDDTITSVPIAHDSSFHTTPIEAYTLEASSQSSHDTQLNGSVPMVAPVSTTQELPMQTVLPMGLNTAQPTPHVVADHSVQLTNGVPMDGASQYTSQLSTSSEPPPPAAAVVAMSEPRHSITDKPPPIRPKKKKVPPPCPPRRSSYSATATNMINLDDSPASQNRRQSADADIPPDVPSRSSANINRRTSDLIGSDLDNVSVFSKIKAFEKA